MSLYRQNHLTHSIVMVEPIDFGYNEQTGQDNEFQNKPTASESEIKKAAANEFSNMVDNLSNHDIQITLLGKSHTQQKLPDAVFPNNWFSTRADGSLVIYPMKTANRQAEVQVQELQKALSDNGYMIKKTIDLRQSTADNNTLEGTGSLIFHHPSGQIFAALSERCEHKMLKGFANSHQYKLNAFNTMTSNKTPVYHTNVLMACGEEFAVITPDVLVQEEASRQAISNLKATVDDCIEITEKQMTESFCGNIIQLKSTKDVASIVMSESAYKGFEKHQIKTLERHGQLIICPINTIEYIGGGSARCMIAENFLPQS